MPVITNLVLFLWMKLMLSVFFDFFKFFKIIFEGGRRFSEGTSADREIQRTLMELLNQMDGFDSLGKVKIIMATNRPDTVNFNNLKN